MNYQHIVLLIMFAMTTASVCSGEMCFRKHDVAGNFDGAGPLLERVEQAAKDIPEFLGEVYAAQAYLARGSGRHELMVKKSQQALTLLPKSSVNSRGIVAMNLGLAYWHMGQMQAAEEVLTEARSKISSA